MAAPRKRTCQNGHPRTPDNLTAARQCRTCHTIDQRARRDRARIERTVRAGFAQPTAPSRTRFHEAPDPLVTARPAEIEDRILSAEEWDTLVPTAEEIERMAEEAPWHNLLPRGDDEPEPEDDGRDVI